MRPVARAREGLRPVSSARPAASSLPIMHRVNPALQSCELDHRLPDQNARLRMVTRFFFWHKPLLQQAKYNPDVRRNSILGQYPGLSQ